LSPKTKDIPRYPYNEVWHTAKLIPAGPADVSLRRGYPYIEYPYSKVSLYYITVSFPFRVGWGEGKESIVDIGRNAKEPLRAIIRALQDTDDRAAGFRAEVELASRWTKLNCDYGTVHNLHVQYCTALYSTTFDFEAASK
jgi:hypothetical protein